MQNRKYRLPEQGKRYFRLYGKGGKVSPAPEGGRGEDWLRPHSGVAHINFSTAVASCAAVGSQKN